MSTSKPVELAWLSAPRPGLIEGLISSGLVPKNQAYITQEHAISNLKTPQKEQNHEKRYKIPPRQIKTAQTHKREPQEKVIHDTENEISTSRSQNPAKIKSLLPQTRPQTGLGISSRATFQVENPLPPITDLISTQRKVPSTREIEALVNQYHNLVSIVEIDQTLSPKDQAQQIIDSSQNVFLVWNKAISLIRSFSEEHAMLFVEIKKFFQSRLQYLPGLFDHYEKLINEITEKEQEKSKLNESLNKLLSDAESALKQQTAYNMRISEELEVRNTQVADLKSALESAEFNRDAAVSDQNTMLIRMQRNEEAKNNAKQLLADAHMKIEDLESLLAVANNKINALEKSGDDIRPKFAELEHENEDLKKELEKLRAEIQKYLIEPKYVDFGALTDPVESEGTKRRKKGKRDHNKILASSLNFNTSSTSFMKGSKISITESPQSTIFDQTESLKSQKKGKSKKSASIRSQLSFKKVFVPDNASIITNFEGPEEEEEKSENLIIPEVQTNISDNSSILEEPVPETKSETDVKKDLKNGLPADYTIDNDQPLDASTMLNYVNRLLPLPLGTSLYAVPDFSSQETKTVMEPKPFFWVARHIITFFQTMTNTDNGTSLDNDCRSIVKQQIMEKGGTPYVGKKIFNELMSSTQFYMHSSPLVQFFLKFMNNELNIIDLIFFKILFNTCFVFIYPNISNLDITVNNTQFLIHIKLAHRIREAFFPHIEFTAADEKHLLDQSKSSPCPELVDFWAFSQQMIMFFRQTHTRFHRQVSALLALVGWSGIDKMNQAIFNQFFTIIQPNISDDELANLWKRYSLEQLKREAQGSINQSRLGLGGGGSSAMFSMSHEDLTNEQEQTKMGFIQFCSDWPEISSNLLKLYYNENLESQLTNLPQPMLMLIKYMRSRFTHFLRDINKKLPPENRAIVEKARNAFRNALVRCDIGDAISCYRRYLQLLDLKLVEQRPYIQLMQNVSESEIKALRDMLLSRENLVCSEIGLAVDPIKEGEK